uniref:Uncharacterized protein n=1 Tax=Opuntia streptacantha TaxID=393608 RepID=A0A7C8ZN17_OPUST
MSTSVDYPVFVLLRRNYLSMPCNLGPNANHSLQFNYKVWLHTLTSTLQSKIGLVGSELVFINQYFTICALITIFFHLPPKNKMKRVDFCKGEKTRTKQIVGNTCWPSGTGVNQFVMRRILIRGYIGAKQTK